MKIKGFGCSFIYGSDLEDHEPTWPEILAQQLDLEYECHAQPGIGNLQILESVLRESNDDAVFVVNWTWIDRFGFVDVKDEQWHTLRPALDHPYADFYFRNMHSQYYDMLTNLIYVKTAINCLLDKKRSFVMTAMDYLLFEQVHPGWHEPTAVSDLQEQIRPHIQNFEGKNFLDWSKEKGHQVSETWHPLAPAHSAAADYMLPAIESILRKA